MSYYTKGTCRNRSKEEVLQQAQEYKAATTKAEAGRIQKQYGLRRSELLRLPYFDITRMVTVDPMHTFLLGMVRSESEHHITENSDVKVRVKVCVCARAWICCMCECLHFLCCYMMVLSANTDLHGQHCRIYIS